MGWLSGYSYRNLITIEGSPDGAQVDYQLELKVHKYHAPIHDAGVSYASYQSVEPQAYYYNGKTYFVYAGESLNPYIMCYTHATETWSEAIKVGTNPLSTDAHSCPAVIVDNGGTIHVFFGCHNTALKHATSTNPEDISAWTVETDIGTGCTYPKVMKDDAGVLWLFTRDLISGNTCGEYYRKSTDWTTSFKIIEPEDTSDRIYASSPAYDATNGRIHLTWTHYDISIDQNLNLYHAYLDMLDGHMYNMAGTDLGTTISFAEAESSCKIVSYTDDWINYTSVIHLDSSNYPHVIYQQLESASYHCYYKAWNGVSWNSAVEITSGLYVGKHEFYINSNSDIDAYICRIGGGFGKWHWNGSSWSLEKTIITYASKPPDRAIYNSHIVENGINPFRVIVGEIDNDDFTNADLDVYCMNFDGDFVHPNNRIGLDGRCLDDFGDIRFTKSDGTTELDYWLESQVATDDAVFWIEFDSIPADPSTGTFYIYYGKAGDTTTSNPVNTLVKYEDFEDADTWDDDLVDVGTPVKTRDTVVYKIGAASLKLEDDDNAAQEGVYIGFTASNNRRVTFYARAIQADKNILWSLTSGGSTVCVINFSTSGTIVYTDNTTIKTAQDYSADIWYKFEICAHIADALWDLYIDDVLIAANITTYSVRTLALSRMYSRTVAVADMPTWWLDHLLIFNWTPNEPAWGAWGSEEAIVVSGLYYYKHLMGGNS